MTEILSTTRPGEKDFVGRIWRRVVVDLQNQKQFRYLCGRRGSKRAAGGPWQKTVSREQNQTLLADRVVEASLRETTMQDLCVHGFKKPYLS